MVLVGFAPVVALSFVGGHALANFDSPFVKAIGSNVLDAARGFLMAIFLLGTLMLTVSGFIFVNHLYRVQMFMPAASLLLWTIVTFSVCGVSALIRSTAKGVVEYKERVEVLRVERDESIAKKVAAEGQLAVASADEVEGRLSKAADGRLSCTA